MKRKPTNIVEQLRAAILDTGRSLYSVATGSGAPYSAVTRFMAGERGLTFATAAKIAAHLGLELRPVSTSKKRGA